MIKILEHILKFFVCVFTFASIFFYIGFLLYVYSAYDLKYLIIVLNPLNIWNLFAIVIIFLPSLISIWLLLLIMQKVKKESVLNNRNKYQSIKSTLMETASLSENPRSKKLGTLYILPPHLPIW